MTHAHTDFVTHIYYENVMQFVLFNHCQTHYIAYACAYHYNAYTIILLYCYDVVYGVSSLKKLHSLLHYCNDII